MEHELPESWTREDEDAAPPACDPIAAARAILARFPIRAPGDIAIELMAADRGAYVVPRRTATADARVVRDGREAFIVIAPEALGTPRGRFSVAHELSHLDMHARWFDAIARIHGAPRTRGREFRVEREANQCASELLLPRFLLEPMCAAVAEPSLDAVSRAAGEFRASLTATARKWAALSPAACAFVESSGGRIYEAKRSESFRGVAVRRRSLEAGTVAAELAAGGGGMEKTGRAERIHGAAWGGRWIEGGVVEESLRVPGTETVLTWLWHR